MWEYLFNQVIRQGCRQRKLRSRNRSSPVLRLSMAALIAVIACGVILIKSDAEGQSAPFAAPAAPDIFYLAQPDGSKISVHARGDERFNWMETAEGYTIEKATDGFWYYVSGKSGLSGPVAEDKRNGFALTNVQAHRSPPGALPKHIRPPALVNMPKTGGAK